MSTPMKSRRTGRVSFKNRAAARKSYLLCTMCRAKFLATGRAESARLDAERHVNKEHNTPRNMVNHFIRTEW